MLQNYTKHKELQNAADEWLAPLLPLRTSEVSGSNRGAKTGYPQ